MAKYTSKTVTLPVAASVISDKFADLSSLEGAVAALPEAERSRIGDVKFTADTLSIKTPQVGELKFQVVERNPQKVVFRTVTSPLPLELSVNLNPLDDSNTELSTAIDVEIPAMLKPMLGGMMQKAADSFGDLMVKINGK
ncbi:MAG: hypothetical protein K2L80_09870 [Muribaculaceae bacterium]|nr:hypothetical protein [Muribaculaceae bacterium]